MFNAAIAKQIQPVINATPPKGVTAPSILIPLRLRAYKLPENKTTPVIKAYPAIIKNLGLLDKLFNSNATKIKARA